MAPNYFAKAKFETGTFSASCICGQPPLREGEYTARRGICGGEWKNEREFIIFDLTGRTIVLFWGVDRTSTQTKTMKSPTIDLAAARNRIQSAAKSAKSPRNKAEARPYPEPAPAVIMSPDCALRRTAFNHGGSICISDLAAQSGVLLSYVRAWVLRMEAAGLGALDQGDWSWASDAERAGAVELRGLNRLYFRLF